MQQRYRDALARSGLGRDAWERVLDAVSVAFVRGQAGPDLGRTREALAREVPDPAPALAFLQAEGVQSDWSFVVQRDTYDLFGPINGRRSRMTISAATLDDFLDAVHERVERIGCDHSTRHAQAVARAKDLPVEQLIAACARFGGYCDCEIVLNVEPESAEDADHHARATRRDL